jgi:nitrogen regulatory protein PII
MTGMFKSGKLLITMLGRHRGEQLVAVAKAAGARGGTMLLGRSQSPSCFLRALSLADVQQDIIFILMGEEAPAVLGALRAAAKGYPRHLKGMAILLDVPDMFIRVSQGANGPGRLEDGENNHMESGYSLITVIVNNGYADDIMAAARKAGARGGTIINARGTGTEEDVKFFGIPLVPEKEMLLIVTENSQASAISEAMISTSHLSEPGVGIMFSINVEQFITLGR